MGQNSILDPDCAANENRVAGVTKTRAPKTRAFLAAIRVMPNVRKAAEAAGVSPYVHYRRMKADERYKAAFLEAWECGCQALEDKATERAIDGWEEPVYQGGELVGTKQKFSDRCLLGRLKAEMPEKYGDKVEHSGPGGAPIQSTLTITFVAADERPVSGEAPVSL